MTRRRVGLIAVIVTVVIIGAIIIRQRLLSTSPPLVNAATLRSFPSKNESSADTSHVDVSMPPTNSWLSGMVLQQVPEPVYPMPLSFLAKGTGFEIGLPPITVSATEMSGEHVPSLVATISSASAFQLTRYDKISGTLTYKNTQGVEIGQLTLAEGVPYVYYHALADGEITLSNVTGASSSLHYLRYKSGTHDYAVVASDGATVTTSGTTVRITFNKNDLITFYALPGDGKDTLRQYAANEVTGVTTTYQVSSQAATTTLQYNTANHQPTVFAPMGYRSVENAPQPLITYDSIYGAMKATAGNKFTTSVPTSTASNQLDISHLTEAHRQTLIKDLNDDVSKTKITANDSYFAGKQLARAANLLDLAEQLKRTNAVDKLTSILENAMAARLNGTYFYYDSKLKGIAATTKAFGSEDFNDHHFHYGYFIYAASILGRYDNTFLAKYKDQVNLLVADIASYDASASFPAYRYFDAYVGHSWAAGLAPFVDGNNQESSSEAMNAWNAVVVWAQLIHNDPLQKIGEWMLANEAASARAVWRQPPVGMPNASQYTSPLASLNFGGKRVYATFFSDTSSAKFGIQLIPMNPFMVHQLDSSKTAEQLVGSSIANNDFNVPLGDYILMYTSLYDKERALKYVDAQQDAFIDDGNSRTYLDAFVYSQADS